MASPPPATGDTILFRPSKKRKIYRQRLAENDDEPPSTNISASPPVEAEAQSLEDLIASSAGVPEIGEVERTDVSMAEILRLRKRNKRVGGVEFRAESSGHVLRDGEGALVVKQKGVGDEGQVQEGGVSGVPRKFAPQTGTVGDVNKHMMAYIDSELAKRRAEGVQAIDSKAVTSLGFHTLDGASRPGNSSGEFKKADAEIQRQPATVGKLLEIDLGDEARKRNVERTNQARRKLNGEEVEDEDDERGGKKAKVRLGRDGKPWRGRKRRASEDVKRDELVEEVLRENRLEIYDEPVVEPATINDDQAADDRIAEAFRREFMDAVSQRQRKKTAPAPPPNRTAAGKKEEELKGPKLGGSRNARAAMRDSMLKAGKK